MNSKNFLIAGKNMLRNTLASFGLYCLMLAGTQGISELFSSKINNQNLEQILKIEKRRVGLNEDRIIYVRISKNEDETSAAQKLNENKYQIVLSPNPSLNTLRHELYHISDGHCDKPYNLLKYLFIQEPQATIYSITGLKP